MIIQQKFVLFSLKWKWNVIFERSAFAGNSVFVFDNGIIRGNKPLMIRRFMVMRGQKSENVKF